MRIFFTSLFFSLLLTNIAFADTSQKPFVEVVGTSVNKVVPNQFAFHIELKSFDKKLAVASAESTRRVEAISKSLKKLGVARKYVVASEVTVKRLTKGYLERGTFQFLGYLVSRRVRIILHDPKRIEPAIKKVFKVGVETLNITFHHTEIDRLEKKAEISAMRDAKEKADRLLGAIGAKRGRPVAVVVTSSGASRSANNFTYRVNTPNLGSGFSLGKIDVQRFVKVTFEIK